MLKITQADRDSALYRKLNAYLDDKINQLRIRNDQPLDPVETAQVRGRIKEVSILQARLTAPQGLEVVDDGT